MKLKEYLYSKSFLQLLDKSIVDKYCNLFKKKDQVYYSHAMSTLLTLSLFVENQYEK